MLVEGVVLGNRYRLNNRVAAGGMGDVWRCRDDVLERAVAVKILLPPLVSDPQFIARFQSEARIMAALRHPGIVQVHDFGEASLPDGNRVSYLVMEYVDGESLLERISKAGRLTVEETLSIVAQTAHALHAAHVAGIVHRDVKPGNLLVQRDGTMVVVDFGIARSAFMGNITASNMVLGTAYYMSPEQAAGRPVSAATDIYALGAVAYCCLTGRPPFTGDNPVQVALQHMRDAPPPLPPDVPAPVAALLARALAKEPADRYHSGADFADAARAVLHAMPTVPQVIVGQPSDVAVPSRAARPSSAAEPTAGDRKERRLALIGAGGAVLLALIVLIATALQAGQAASGQAMSSQGPTSETSTEPAAASTPDGTAMPKVPGVTSTQPQPAGSSGKPASSPAAKPTATPSPTLPAQMPLPAGYTVKTRTVNRGASSSESYDRYIEIYNGAGTLVGSGEFISDPLNGGPGDALRACDSYADGMALEIRMDINPSGGFQRTDRVASTRGFSSPYCSPFATGDMAENTLVALKLCLVKGTTEYCAGTYYARA